MPTKYNTDSVFDYLTQFPPTSKAPKAVVTLLVVVAVLLCSFIGLFVGILSAVGLLVVFLLLFGVSVFLGSGRRILRQIGAIKLNSKIEPRLFGVLENLCLVAGVGIPEVYTTDDDVCINGLALALSSKKSALVFTTGVLSSLDRIELEAVVASQVAALRRKEERTAILAIKLMAIPTRLWPSTSSLVLRLTGIDRSFFIDQTAILLTKYPPGLYGALKKASSAPSLPKRLNAPSLMLTGSLWFVPASKSQSGTSTWSPESRMQVMTEM
jgi:hypothetical protein